MPLSCGPDDLPVEKLFFAMPLHAVVVAAELMAGAILTTPTNFGRAKAAKERGRGTVRSSLRMEEEPPGGRYLCPLSCVGYPRCFPYRWMSTRRYSRCYLRFSVCAQCMYVCELIRTLSVQRRNFALRLSKSWQSFRTSAS
jgi:hypothetical protein